jgi:hypothetical protein
MSPRLLVLSLTGVLTLGCSGATKPTARATPAPAPAPSAASAAASSEEAMSVAAPSEIETAGVIPEAPESSEPSAAPETPTAAAEPAVNATPARFATTRATTAPVGVIERPLERPIVVVPTTSEASLPAQPAPKTAADHFDAQLATLLRNEIPTDPALDIAEDDRKLLRSVIDSLASFRMTLRDGSALRQTKVAPLLDLSEKIRSEIPLSLPTLLLCRSVQQFGVYDAIEPARFTAGKETPVVVYCEVDHFRSKPSPDGGWETKLTYEAVLYSDAENAVAVISKKATPIVDRCRNRRRDFFLADRMTIPANLPVGKYVLKVTVIDQLANLVAEKSAPVVVTP